MQNRNLHIFYSYLKPVLVQNQNLLEEVDDLKEQLNQALSSIDSSEKTIDSLNIKIEELSRPEMYAQLVAEDIGEQLQKRASFRRTMKRAMEASMEAGAKGIKIQLAGRLGGAEMARREKQISGSIPLSTLRAQIDYGFSEAKTAQGNIGIQVWINQGMYQQEEKTDGADAEAGQAPKSPKRAYKR